MTIYIGTAEKTGQTVSLAPDVRRKHLAIFGKSGVGKTTLLRNMIVADIHAGIGVTVIDPHGSLIDDLLTAIPKHRTNDVIYLNPAEPERVVGINVLEPVARSDRSLVVSALISTLRNLYPHNWGPRTEYILEHTVYALLEQPEPVTLAALPRLFTDQAYRRQLLANVTDPAILAFFDFYEKQNDRLREESIAPLLNKVSKFVSNPLLRAVVGQSKSSFDFRWVMDKSKILLCRLSKGALGDDVSSLLGSLIVTKLAIASLSRENVPESERALHVLYADEVQNFTHGVDFPTILSESRKYALSLTIATQTLTQLPDKSLEAVFGNCGTLISFRVSGEDAKALVREFGVSGEGPKTAEEWFDLIVPASELQNLADYKLYLRTLIDGRPRDPELVKAFPPFPAFSNENHANVVVKTSLQRFGRDRCTIEENLRRFLSRN